MKRHPQLQPLSRQHHNGLLAVLLLKKGIARSAPTNIMAAFINDFWNTDLEEHFTAEEIWLLPEAKNTVMEEALHERLNNEHEQLRRYIDLIQEETVDVAVIASFANLLEQHIRFEERIYFPRAEKLLTENQLQFLGHHLNEVAEHSCINYPIKFWE
jgi:hemerythrin-like domain-containing protein